MGGACTHPAWIQNACKERDMYLAALAPVAHGIKFSKQVSDSVSE